MNSLIQPRMVSLVNNSTKKGAKIQNEYMFLLRCIMATYWIGNICFNTNNATNTHSINFKKIPF